MLIQDLFVKNSYKNQQQIYILCYKNSLGTYVHGGSEREGSCPKRAGRKHAPAGSCPVANVLVIWKLSNLQFENTRVSNEIPFRKHLDV